MTGTTDASESWLHRHYPLLLLALTFVVAPQIGGSLGHHAPELGSALFGAVYEPFAIVSWFGSDSDPARSAMAGTAVSYLIGFAVTVSIMAIEFQNGRRFGMLDVLLFPLVIWLDVTTWSTGTKIEMPKATPETPARNAAVGTVARTGNSLAAFVVCAGFASGGVSLAFFGASGLIDRARFSAPRAVSLETFVREHPTAGWFAIGGARIDSARGVQETSAYRKDRMLYAVRASGGGGERVAVVVDAPLDVVPASSHDVVTGTVEGGSELEPLPERQRDVARLGRADASYAVLRPGGPPSPLGAVLRLLGGVALLYVFAVAPLRRVRTRERGASSS